ncbi:MAG: hypothetical protein UR66_C0001G0122 [Candidatus Moranbacteria bacterium GW2011_GWE1_35_17]|nr:MAG: hypothetical protein UR66_C0001G0122 [Candidatus Moranbacteria bacterium GW2011_GWE1_35_17]
MNKKISTITGALVLLAIAGALSASFLFSDKQEKETQDQKNVVSNNSGLENKEEIKQEAKKTNGDMSNKESETTNKQGEEIDTSSWKICKNEKANYEFKYPNDWLIVNRYLTVLDSCNNPSSPRSSGFSIGPDRYSASNKSFGIGTSTQEDLEVTIYKGATSLDEYYSRNDKLLSSRTKLKETTLQDKRVDWFREQSDNKISIWFFHNNTLYEIRSDIEDQELLETILNTFKFPNN